MTACRLSLWLSGEMAQPGGSEAYAQLTWSRKEREYGRQRMDCERSDGGPETVSVRCKGVLRNGAKRSANNWTSAIRQALGRGRRDGSATGPIGSSAKAGPLASAMYYLSVSYLG